MVLSTVSNGFFVWQWPNLLLLAEDRGQAADLCSERGAHMLRAVRHQILHGTHNVAEEGVPVDQRAEAGDLAGNSGPHLGLAVLEQFYKGGNQIPGNDLLIDCLGDLHTQLVLVQVTPRLG